MSCYPSFRDAESFSGITWRDLTALEPALEGLLFEALRASTCCRRWTDVDRLFAPIRNALAELVGFAGRHRHHSVLGSVGAYQIAYWKLYDAVAGLLPRRSIAMDEANENRGGTVVEPSRTESAALPATLA
jgi:hypothetical protein